MFSNYVKVVFKNGEIRGQNQYEFVNFIEDLQVGDVVLVKLTTNNYNGYNVAVATVAQINTKGNAATSYVIERINDSDAQEKMRQFNKKKEIEKKMKILYEKQTSLELYRKIAKENSEMKELLEEYDSL